MKKLNYKYKGPVLNTAYKICLLFIALTINLHSVTAQSLEETIQDMIDEVSIENLSNHIQTLENAGGTRSRIAFTPGIDSATVYIKEAFDDISGLTSVEIDTFYISTASSPYDEQPQFNVVATIEGKTNPEKTYVIGAHMDATANRDDAWTGTNWDTIEAPGADDNATGVAAILEMARIMTDSTHNFSSDYTIKLIAFGAEESGASSNYHYSGNHHGSIHYARQARSAGEEILGMVSVDMIGFNEVYDYASIVKHNRAVNESITLGEAYIKANLDFSIGLETNQPPFENGNYSDHQSFADEGFPSILVIENAPWEYNSYYSPNQYYHETTDTFDKLNMDQVKKITQMNIAAVASLSQTGTNTEEEKPTLADKIQLSQNYPNPFNPSTVIKYNLREATHVELNVYNILGKEVATLVNGSQAAGEYNVTFDATNISGQLTSGVYIYRLKAGENVFSRKMILMK